MVPSSSRPTGAADSCDSARVLATVERRSPETKEARPEVGIPDPTTHVLSVSSIRDGGCRKVDLRHIQRLLDTADRWPPIVLDGATNKVVDGQHRLEAHRRREHDLIEVVFVTVADEADRIVQGLTANESTHLALTAAARRDACRRLLRAAPTQSNGTIHRACGVSMTTIQKYREELESTGEISVESGQLRQGRDGKSYRRPSAARAQLPRHRTLVTWVLQFLNHIVQQMRPRWFS